MRTALTTSELAEANLVEERMYLPASFLGVVFLALLMVFRPQGILGRATRVG